MKSTFLIITALALLSTGAMAGNKNCKGNWVNFACGVTAPATSTGSGTMSTANIPDPPAPDPEPCDTETKKT